MLIIRFARVGRKNRAQYRIVLQEHTVAPTGRHIAVLGSWDPHAKKSVLKADKIKQWIEKGAQVSDSAFNLFVKEGVIDAKKRMVKMEKPKIKEVSAEVEKKPAEETPVQGVKVEEASPTKEAKEEVKVE